MKTSIRFRKILDALAELYPDAHCELNYTSSFQLLVATVLSAQCTDQAVNRVTSRLFKKYPDSKKMAVADPIDIENQIRSIGLFRAKTRSLLGLSKKNHYRVFRECSADDGRIDITARSGEKNSECCFIQRIS